MFAKSWMGAVCFGMLTLSQGVLAQPASAQLRCVPLSRCVVLLRDPKLGTGIRPVTNVLRPAPDRLVLQLPANRASSILYVQVIADTAGRIKFEQARAGDPRFQALRRQRQPQEQAGRLPMCPGQDAGRRGQLPLPDGEVALHAEVSSFGSRAAWLAWPAATSSTSQTLEKGGA